jgi:PIF1-like helicase
LVSIIYPQLRKVLQWPQEEIREYFSERVILSPRNMDIDEVNLYILNMKFPGEPREYTSLDTAFKEGGV